MKRTPKTQEAYNQRKKEVDVNNYDFSDEQVIEENENYKIVVNSYPYDAFAETHHLLIPKAWSMSKILFCIEEGIIELDYDSVIFNIEGRTVFTPHLHLVRWK